MKIPIKARGGARTEKVAPRLDRDDNGYTDRGIDQCSIILASRTGTKQLIGRFLM